LRRLHGLDILPELGNGLFPLGQLFIDVDIGISQDLFGVFLSEFFGVLAALAVVG
jgi:hypothetical protein